MKSSLLDNLKNIVQMSLEKKALYQQLSEIEEQVFAKTKENSEVESSLDGVQAKLHTKKKQLHQLELQAGELSEQENQLRQKMEKVHNQKELDSLTHELQSAQNKRTALEDQLIQEWNGFERDQTLLQQKTQANLGQVEENNTLLAEMNEEIEALRQKIHPMQQIIEDASQSLPEEIRDVYMRIESKKVKDPICPLVNNMCTGCYHTLPTQFTCDIEEKRVGTCLHCYRILYLPPKDEKAEQPNSEENNEKS